MILKKINSSEIIKWHQKNGGKVIDFGLVSNHYISVPRAINLCDEFNISILTSKFKDKASSLLSSTKCKLIITSKELIQSNYKGIAFLIHENPKKLLIDFCKEFYSFESPIKTTKIHPSAIIEDGAILGKNICIEANVYISENSVIESNCHIGQNTVIKNASIGTNVRIGANNTIGENGFGYSKKENGKTEFFPHFGRVIIHENVQIGNNNCIDRGSLSDTVIMNDVKIDNLVHIAHNVRIEENSLIIANSMIAGSVTIGKNGWVAPSSSIRNNVNVGNNTTIGIGSVVTKNIDVDQIVLGNPAIPIEDFIAFRKAQKELVQNKE